MNKTETTLKYSISVIVPCLNEENSLPAFLEAIIPVFNEAYSNSPWEIIFVNDGSTDATEQIIRKAHREMPNIWGITLTRNFGHQPALFVGLTHARGEIVAFLDADLQDPPPTLLQLIEAVRKDHVDVAYGIRAEREAVFVLKYCYHIFYRLMAKISEHPWQIDAGDFCAMNRKAVDFILSFPESDRFLRGLRSWIGLRQMGISYMRPMRQHGTSKYNFSRLVKLALKGIVGFSTLPLRLASLMSLALAFGCALSGLLLLANRVYPAFTILGYNIGANPGIATVAILMLLISSCIMASLGIIGEYLSVVLVEVKRRPQALVSAIIRNE